MKIVFDTNVLISNFLFGSFSAEVFEYCYIYHEIYVSKWIIDELTEKLINKFKIPQIKTESILEKIYTGCKLINPEGDIPNVCRDFDDNNILHLGLFIKSDFIVTGDSDLLDIKEYKGIKILNPRDFWKQRPNF